MSFAEKVILAVMLAICVFFTTHLYGFSQIEVNPSHQTEMILDDEVDQAGTIAVVFVTRAVGVTAIGAIFGYATIGIPGGIAVGYLLWLMNTLRLEELKQQELKDRI